MGFPRQECWSGLPFPSPGNLPNPGIDPASPVLADRFFTTEPPGKPMVVPTVIPFLIEIYVTPIATHTHRHTHTHKEENRRDVFPNANRIIGL